MNAIDTTVYGKVEGMFIADGVCHLFTRNGTEPIRWYYFSSVKSYLDNIVKRKSESGGSYVFEP